VTILSIFLFKYALLAVAVFGLLESLLILRLNRGDLRTLLRERVNGPKKLSTELRINQSAYLLAVFCILFLIGAVYAMTPLLAMDLYLQPQILIGRLGMLLLGVLLIAKQRSVRRHRDRLDQYYDDQQKALESAKVHMHRRADDPPLIQGE
jgi:ABC-type multidrug transport system fused ATPase/permease subunit